MTHETAQRFSQNDEQDHILAHFLHQFHGRFLDIGAYDGITFSNTRALLERGWFGVYVEPSPTVLPGLMRNSAGWPVRVVPQAIGPTPGKVAWFDCGDGVATPSRRHRDKWRALVPYVATEVEMVTPETLLGDVGDDFDFVTIDTEGTNEAVMLGMPWAKLTKCTLVCIEHDRAIGSITATLSPLGFREVARNPENMILAR
jgi:FkbM family methyltransferase